MYRMHTGNEKPDYTRLGSYGGCPVSPGMGADLLAYGTLRMFNYPLDGSPALLCIGGYRAGH